MQDLTKILKVGDRVWSLLYGEGVVRAIKAGVNFPFSIDFKGDDAAFGRWFDKYGRGTAGGLLQLYPVDQRPEIPSPVWPEVFEIDGVAYKKGEWVAVSDDEEFWCIEKLSGTSVDDNFPKTSTHGHHARIWQKIRKLPSFNNPDNA